ncbi:MAG: hypothetical protein K2J76_02330 [Oscillospiraceae bacterium]|nr:hypothetical protein [Oscillospiraceae bacterium]
MNMISSAKAPYLLHSEKSGQPKATFGNRFRDVLEKEKAQNNMIVSAAEIAVNEMDNIRKKEAVQKTSSDMETENFREDYKDTYNKI